MNQQELNTLRQEVSNLNCEILELLVQRGQAVQKLGDYKRANQLPVHDPSREQEILEEISNMQHAPYPVESIHSIYRAIFDAAKDIQYLQRNNV